MLAVFVMRLMAASIDGASREQISLLEFDKCFHGNNLLTWSEAD